jgi:uncharacterized protein
MVIGLAKGGLFNTLASLYAPLFIPPAVVQEIVAQGQGRAGVAELKQALGRWITEAMAPPGLVQQLPAVIRSTADRQVLALAQAQAVDHVLTSDARLVRQARSLGLICLQVPELVILAKRRGLVSAVQPVLDRMRQEGFGIDDATYEAALRAAGEAP